MLPIGPLMIEHRLIERMIQLMDAEVKNIRSGRPPDTGFIRVAVDFVKTYADALHHGKEEKILFRDLAKKKMSPEHRRIMHELIQEHVAGRENVRALVGARDRYLEGEAGSADDIARLMDVLVQFYPKHIAKEDKGFFIPVMTYFSPDEQTAMLDEFHEFDRKFVHVVYGEMVSTLDGKRVREIR